MGESILCLSKIKYASPNSDWHSINWVKVNKAVKKLQIRIVKALRESKHRKLKSLQWLLTHSFSGKAIAVRRVTENQGKNTPGIDKVKWSRPELKTKAIFSLKTKGYKPRPLRRVLIPKSNGKKMRPLGIPTMKDRAMQALFKLALEPIAETTADKHSYGFRPERNAADAISQCFNVLSRKRSAQWVLEADIKGCFDNISHQWLLDNIPINKTILRKWLKAGFIDSNKFFTTDEGTPQGGIASPLLANLALDGLEKELSVFTEKHFIHLVRYADDFIVTSSSEEILKNKVITKIKDFLKKRNLSLSKEKTNISHISNGFDFLGVNLRKYKGKLLIKPSKQSKKNILAKIRKTIKSNKASTQDELIKKLNPLIRGWCNYHKPFVASKAFNFIDCHIFRCLWQWCKRRHPMKNILWIKNRYFKTNHKSIWIFSDKLKLQMARDVKIVRHIKIKADFNPYDKKWEEYLEKRIMRKMLNNSKLIQRLRNIWLEQKGKCLICFQFITKESGYEVHHILPKIEGGTNISANLLLLHQNCHKQVHSKRLTVLKPLS